MPRTARIGLLAALLAVTPAWAAAQDEAGAPAASFDADGYRTARYRSPVTSDIAPAQRMAIDTALSLGPGVDALFLDVMPTEGAVRDPSSGTWLLSARHETIPGAQWHPETGRAPVDGVLWTALEAAIADARRDRPDLPVIVFCRADCWMSWNAARRLAAGGISNTFWLAEGTDGWHAAGRPLVTAIPVAVPAPRCKRGR